MNLTPKYSPQQIDIGSRYPTSYIGFGMYADGEFLLENYLTTKPAENVIKLSGETLGPSGCYPLPADQTGQEYGEITMWYTGGKLRVFRNFVKLSKFDVPAALGKTRVVPFISAPGIRYQMTFPTQAFYAPPPIKFLAAYTGQEARNRAIVWGIADDNGKPKD